jgi:formylglycine-generating enzyme required for sulfatase activity
MITIPAGPFLMGTTPAEAQALANAYGYHVSWLDGEVPSAPTLPGFLIDKYPVTNQQYWAFCVATGSQPPPHWGGSTPPTALLSHPVTWINRAQAKQFAKWAGKRLPTEQEWEKAARGTDGRTFPWGNQWDPNACQWNPDPTQPPIGTAPVFAHASGASPYGVFDMVGNVCEWCEDGPDPWDGYLKGGSWVNSEIIDLRPAARNMSGNASNWLSFYGFRCAKDLT